MPPFDVAYLVPRKAVAERRAQLLYLVRHVAVEVRADVPAREWKATAAGLDYARRLAAAPAWRDLSLIASSPERKAVATAEPIAAAAELPLRVEADLREVERRAAVLDASAHRDRVRAYLAGRAIAGWEPLDAAKRRFESSLARLLDETLGPLAVVSHGTVLALYLGLTFEEWERIPLPAVAVVDAGTRVPLHPFVGVEEFLALATAGRG